MDSRASFGNYGSQRIREHAKKILKKPAAENCNEEGQEDLLFFLNSSLNPMLDPKKLKKEANFGYDRSSKTGFKSDTKTKNIDINTQAFAKLNNEKLTKSDKKKVGLLAQKLGYLSPMELRLNLPVIPVRDNGETDKALSAHERKILLNRYICERTKALFDAKLTELKYGNSVLEVLYENEYPCIMVAPRLIGENENQYPYWVTFCMIVFMGINNFYAIRESNGFYIPERSSLGHIITTVADTYLTFRINPGVISDDQVDHLVFSLMRLYTFIEAAIEQLKLDKRNRLTNFISKSGASPLKAQNKGIFYSFQVGKQTTSVVKELTRTLVGRASLGHAISNYLLNNVDDYCDFTVQLFSKLLEHIVYDYFYVSYKNNSFQFSKAHELSDKNWQETMTDTKKIGPWLENLKFVLGSELTSVVEGNINTLVLGSLLQTAMTTSLFMNAREVDLDPGYGSESEDEQTLEDKTTLYGCKVVLPCGMRAILTAACAVADIKGKFKSLNCNFMYYEVKDVVNNKTTLLQQTVDKDKGKGNLYLVDRNYCVNDAKFNKTSLKHLINFKMFNTEKDFSIFDVTSCTESDMADLVYDILVNQQLSLAVLVSSALKHETIGFDNCHTGIVRVIGTNEDDVKKLRESIVINSYTPVSQLSNQVRRTQKYLYGTPTISGILTRLKTKLEFISKFSKKADQSAPKNVPKLDNRQIKTPTTCQQIATDNNCLFKAVAEKVLGSQDFHNELRQATVDYMGEHYLHFSQFLPENFANYLTYMRRTGIAWGGEPEIVALSNLLQIRIRVINPDGTDYGLSVNMEQDTWDLVTLRYCNAEKNKDISVVHNH